MKRTIGAVARALGLNPKTIRYYEDIRLIPPPGREGHGWMTRGRRVYEEEDIERLRFVKEARRLDFSIDDIRQLLGNYESGPPCGCSARPFLKTLIERKLKEIEETAQTLDALRAELQSLHARTLALEGKTPAELKSAGYATPSHAVLGTENVPASGQASKRSSGA